MSGQRPRRLREGIQQANRSGAAIAGGCESGHRLAISAVRHCPRAGSRVGPTPLEGSSACCGTGCEMKKVALSEVKDDLSRYLRLAEKEEIVITRHGKAAGVLIGFVSEDDWFEYRLERDPRFAKCFASARAIFRSGRGFRIAESEASSHPCLRSC